MLNEKDKAYLGGAPASDKGIEEVVRLGHSEELFVWADGSKSTWREHARAKLEDKFTGKWLDGPQVHNLLLGLPLKAAFQVYLEESVLWLQAWTTLQGIGGGFQAGTRIVVLPPRTKTETTLHEIGHVGYAGWMYQRDDLQKAFVDAQAKYLELGLGAARRAGIPFPSLEHKRVWGVIWSYHYQWWNQADGQWWEGIPDNQDEQFAGILSACMGDLALLPPFIGDFFRGMVEP